MFSPHTDMSIVSDYIVVNNTIDIDDNKSICSSSDIEDNTYDDDGKDLLKENHILFKPNFQGVKKSKLINKAINDYVEQFLASLFIDNKTTTTSLLDEWNSKYNQEQLNGYIHQNKIKMKKKVDINEPKKPFNAFAFFSMEKRQQLKTENPKIDDELVPTIAKMWNEIKNDDALLKPYLDLAKEDKRRYDNELNQFKMKREKEEKQKKLERRLAKIKEKNEKKILKAMGRPKSAYYFFIQDERPKIIEENKDFSKKDIHLECQKRWKTLKSENVELFNKYKKIAEEKAKELPPQIPEEPKKKKKEKKYETPRDKKINEEKKNKKEKYNKNKNKVKELELKVKQLENSVVPSTTFTKPTFNKPIDSYKPFTPTFTKPIDSYKPFTPTFTKPIESYKPFTKPIDSYKTFTPSFISQRPFY